MNEKDTIPSKLWEIASGFTEPAQQAAIRKAKEQGFSTEASEISLEETFINLSHSRDVLIDAVNKGRIVQIPLKLQYRLLSEVTKIKLNLDTLISGTSDVTTAFVSAVDDLNATVWQLNLQSTSPELLAFDSKMNQLKDQESQIRRVLGDAKKIEALLAQLQEHEIKAQETSARISELSKMTESHHAMTASQLEAVTTIGQKITAAESIVNAHELEIAKSSQVARDASAKLLNLQTQGSQELESLTAGKEAFEKISEEMTDFLAGAEKAVEANVSRLEISIDKLKSDLSDDVLSLTTTTEGSLSHHLEASKEQIDEVLASLARLEEKITEDAETAASRRGKDAAKHLEESRKEFTTALEGQVALYKVKFDSIESHSNTTIATNSKETERLTEYLKELEGRIHSSIERATGYSLFQSFQKRQIDLEKSKNQWAIILAICVLASLGASGWIIHSMATLSQFNYLFLMKLAISLPIIFAISFCGVQYSRERRLEEEYAFKANISISLEPYRKLVRDLINEDRPEDVAKYTDFIIELINKVFSSPTQHIFNGESGDGKAASGLLKTAGDVAESLIKAKIK